MTARLGDIVVDASAKRVYLVIFRLRFGAKLFICWGLHGVLHRIVCGESPGDRNASCGHRHCPLNLTFFIFPDFSPATPSLSCTCFLCIPVRNRPSPRLHHRVIHSHGPKLTHRTQLASDSCRRRLVWSDRAIGLQTLSVMRGRQR